MAQFIRLNVGGYEYSATKSTLCADPESMLAKMFGGEIPSSKDENGRVIIDRDGEMFQYILNFLRSSKLALPKDFKKIDQLALESDFFQMEELGREIDRIKYKPAVRLYYQEDVTYNGGFIIGGRYDISSYITGISEEIDNLPLQEQGWKPALAQLIEMKGIYKTETLKIGTAYKYIGTAHKSTRDKAYDLFVDDLWPYKTKRFCIQDYLLSNGWKIEKSEKTGHRYTCNFDLMSVTYVKSTD